MFLKILAFHLALFCLAHIAFGQMIPLAGDYVYRTEKKAGADVIKLNADSTFKWYYTDGVSSRNGKWSYKNEKIILRQDDSAKPIEIKTILGEEAERAILYYRKHLYFKRDGS